MTDRPRAPSCSSPSSSPTRSAPRPPGTGRSGRCACPATPPGSSSRSTTPTRGPPVPGPQGTRPGRRIPRARAKPQAETVITNAVYDLLYLHLGVGPVTSATIATIVATITSYLGNRYWSFRHRQRTGVAREIAVFAVLNGIALLIQDAAVAFNYYVLGLGHDKLAGFTALNAGIVLATLFRFWSYRHFVWITPPGDRTGDPDGRPRHVRA